MVLDNASMAVIQKFYYLKSCFSDSADKIISRITTGRQANFFVAWQLLCDRFSNKHLIIHNHIKAIFNIKSVKKILQ